MDTKEIIKLLIQKARVAIKDTIIIFLANIKNVTSNCYDYSDSSILTEFLSMEEYNELLTSLQNFGFFTIVYYNSEEFIKDYYNEKFETSKIIIFEGTQKGIGKARDSYIPAFCDLEGLLHTGPNAYVNGICTNKYHWTKLLESHNISVPDSWQYNMGEWLNGQSPVLNKTLIAMNVLVLASINSQLVNTLIITKSI
jgi:D-alanine-D-alanine ligase